MATRIPALLDPPIGFAHRGARAHARENTLDAFKLAHQMGATGIETDVWITADGVVVLNHDGSVWGLPTLSTRRLFGRPIRRTSRASLPAHIPTIDEYYETCGTDLPLSVDIKDDAAFDGLLAAARARGAAERLWICHHRADVLGGWRAAALEVKLVHSTRLDRLPKGPERHAADLAAAGIDAVNFHREDWNGGLTTLYHRFELHALGWDAQQVRHIAELVDAGIDAVYSDHVDRMVEVLARPAGDAAT
ncbi:MAG: glycerophosphodiester phosphodiesterase [Acidimicrobiaceae bacterium]|nr:glycerophosphodiester phosphodiesterase [Acidimicrobiaceae bacterium]MXY12001.1 glycerophosphodiester phosphodiesterase [Acidimicrobiaceae bacterium]MXZ65209.1 glycerophosphodiester phosphodiesterase [Acidimicrobiaceae bacterium]MYF34571.1 glycerophosphodiester phosphodiesterase [Acidimicrobiaceae bacterium]MYG79827.1 glycerophosphodiester phosphodiesterase [Acidimicrobiaceae bacterium]